MDEYTLWYELQAEAQLKQRLAEFERRKALAQAHAKREGNTVVSHG